MSEPPEDDLDMNKRLLYIVVQLVFVLSLGACAGGGGLSSTNNTADSQIPRTVTPATSALASSDPATSAPMATALVSRTTGALVKAAITTSVAIDAGGAAVAPNWVADTDYSTLGQSGVDIGSRAIDTSKVTNPAPPAVYQTVRWARSLTYTIPKLTSGATYIVRLHFVEPYFRAPQKRVFNAAINNVQALSGFDIFASAGGANIATVRQFTTSADATGTITIKLDATVNNAMIAGIELNGSSAIATSVPSATPVATTSIAPAPQASTYYSPSAPAAAKLALNPNPLTGKICASDPCSPVVDSQSQTFNSNWFGNSAAKLPSLGLQIPGNSASYGYDQIPIYSASNSDPIYNIQCSNGGDCNPTSTLNVHIPNGAKVDSYSDGDGLVGVVNPSSNIETDIYHFNTGSHSATSPTQNAINNGSPNPLWVWYAGQNPSAFCFAGGVNKCSGGASSGITQSSIALDPVEWLQQRIPHMLHLIGSCVSSSSVYPARAGSSDGTGPSGCPPEGEILWLDKTDAQIEAMATPRWVKTLYHNLHDYGWLEADSRPAAIYPQASSTMTTVGDASWTAVGKPSQWSLMFNEMKAEGSSWPTYKGSEGPYYSLQIPTASGIAVSNFHWLQYNSNH